MFVDLFKEFHYLFPINTAKALYDSEYFVASQVMKAPTSDANICKKCDISSHIKIM